MVSGEQPSDRICRKIEIISFTSLLERGLERGLLKKAESCEENYRFVRTRKVIVSHGGFQEMVDYGGGFLEAEVEVNLA